MNRQENIRLGFLGETEQVFLILFVRRWPKAQAATAANDKMLLNIAVSYSGRDELVPCYSGKYPQ